MFLFKLVNRYAGHHPAPASYDLGNFRPRAEPVEDNGRRPRCATVSAEAAVTDAPALLQTSTQAVIRDPADVLAGALIPDARSSATESLRREAAPSKATHSAACAARHARECLATSMFGCAAT